MLLLKQILIIVAIFYLFILLFLFLQQKRFIFFPTRAKHDLTAGNVVRFSLVNNDATLRGWLVQHEYAAEKIIMYYGGNAEDIYYAAEQFKNLGETAALLVHYRGYGTSSGSPGEKEFYSDALAVYDELQKKYAPRHIYLMGRSLGAGIACYVASQRKSTGVILITPFDSIESLAKKQFPFLPTTLLLRHKFNTIEYVQQFDTPTLIIYGGRDRIVKPALTENLIRHMKARKKVILIEEAEHNNIELFDEYHLAILQFIQ
jgi:hypothetical protein